MDHSTSNRSRLLPKKTNVERPTSNFQLRNEERALHFEVGRRTLDVRFLSLMNILLIQLKRIGDLILTTPAIAALREKFPEATLSLVVATLMRLIRYRDSSQPGVRASIVRNVQRPTLNVQRPKRERAHARPSGAERWTLDVGRWTFVFFPS